MAVSRDLGRVFERLQQEVEQAAHETPVRIADQFVRKANARISRATGGDQKLSGTARVTGVRRRSSSPMDMAGRKVEVVSRKLDAGSVLLESRGPIKLVEGDVKKHIVTSRHATGDTGRRVNAAGKSVKIRNSIANRQASVMAGVALGGGRRAVLHWGNNYARYVRASSKGRHPWANTRDEMEQAQRAIVAAELRRAIMAARR
mgnify:CR=1 FL=1